MKSLNSLLKIVIIVAIISNIYTMIMAGVFDILYMFFRIIFLFMVLSTPKLDYKRLTFPFIMCILFAFLIAIIPGLSKYDSETMISYQFRLIDMLMPLILGFYFIYLNIRNKHTYRSAYIFLISTFLLISYYSINLILLHINEAVDLSNFSNVFFLVRSRIALPFTKYLMFTVIGLKTLIDLEHIQKPKKSYASKKIQKKRR